MITEPIFAQDAYLTEADGHVIGRTEQGGIILDRCLFYPTGGGQPGDKGHLDWDGGSTEVATAVKGEAGAIVLVPVEGSDLPSVGANVRQRLDWDQRFGHMRVHTALHLLSVVIPLQVSGGSISFEKGRLDFNMPEAPEDKESLQTHLQDLIDRDLPITDEWISEADLDANPGLVKTMSVSPPRGAGRVRLVRIGHVGEQVDLQPCGGTHVARTSEIGRVRIGKIEKKGKQNRRVYMHLDG